jgi:hypothetical protein
MNSINTCLPQIISCENKYSILGNQPENFLQEEKGPLTLTEESSDHFANYGKKRGQRKSRNRSTPHCMGNIVHQSNLTQHKIQYDQRCDQNINNIPTIINGQLNFSRRQNISDITTNKWDQVRNLVKESEIEILENKIKHLKSNKHKILMQPR